MELATAIDLSGFEGLPAISRRKLERVRELAHLSKVEEDFSYFVRKGGVMLDGHPFSFEGHEYLREPYRELRGCREVIFEKAAQMGVSTLELLDTFHGAKFGVYPHGVLYLLPSKTDVTEFSKSKAQGIIDENEMVRSWITDTDAANIKRVGSSWVFFRGMQSRIGLKTLTIDHIVFDEIEEVEDWSLVALAEERMSHVENPTVHRLSVPSIPNYGIDAYFSGSDDAGINPSDQKYWLLRCGKCGEYTCLEDEFPECIVVIDNKKQTAMRVCRKCRGELDISRGEWVAKKPNEPIRGYHFSQLFSKFVNPWKIIDQFNKKREMETLFNDKLGIPYVESDARLEVQEVLALCGSDLQLAAFPGPCSMGVDQPKEEGGKFHVTVAYKSSTRPVNVVRITTVTTWADLADLMKKFNVTRAVVDGLPDQSKARSFASEFGGQVYLCYYAEKQKGAYKWNDDSMTVSVDRTESLNASTRIFHDKQILLPRRDAEVELFARHCHNIARKKEEDKDSGSVRHVWKRTGADHWRHSINYCYIALGEIGEYVKPKESWETEQDRLIKEEYSWKTV